MGNGSDLRGALAAVQLRIDSLMRPSTTANSLEKSDNVSLSLSAILTRVLTRVSRPSGATLEKATPVQNQLFERIVADKPPTHQRELSTKNTHCYIIVMRFGRTREEGILLERCMDFTQTVIRIIQLDNFVHTQQATHNTAAQGSHMIRTCHGLQMRGSSGTNDRRQEL